MKLNYGNLSAVLIEEVPEGTVVVLVEGRVDEWVKEGVGVAEPEENALPDRRYGPREKRCDQLSQKEGDPAEHKYTNQDSNHECRATFLLLPPRLAVRLKCYGGVTDRKRCLWTLPTRLFRLQSNKHTLTMKQIMKFPLS